MISSAPSSPQRGTNAVKPWGRTNTVMAGRRTSAVMARRRTRAIMEWERLYAFVMPSLCILAVYIAASLVDIWQYIPGWMHLGALIASFAAVIALILRNAKRFPAVTPEGVAARIEEDAGLPVGLLADLSDQPFNGPSSSALWQAHQARLQSLGQNITLKAPRALIDKTDPFVLRYPALLALIIGLFVAGDLGLSRLKNGFLPRFDRHVVMTLDVWIERPDYTGQPPIFLVRAGALPKGQAETITVPANSVFHAQISRDDDKPIKAKARAASDQSTENLDFTLENGTTSLTHALSQNTAIALSLGGTQAIWPINVTADLAPSIEWQEDPATEGGTRIILSVTTGDDYGITEAQLSIRLADELPLPPDAPKPSEQTRSTPMTIQIPALRGPAGPRQIDIDLTEHVWAGLPVAIEIKVTDGNGAAAISTPKELTLPIRTFYNPLARTVIEQRRSLALAPQQWQRSARLFDALTFAPEKFARSGREYLLIRATYHDIFEGHGTNTEELVEGLWPLAIALEDEGLTLARQRLEAAQAALREALARGASQREINELIENLRQAMNDYVAALAQSGDANASESSDNQTLKSQDLDDILDEIAQLRAQGDTEEARKRLAELEQLLQNLQISPSGEGEGQGSASEDQPDEGDGEGSGRPLDATGNLIQEQRELSDETFSARRGDRAADGLGTNQSDLAQRADELAGQAATGDEDNAPSQEATEAFTDAANAMRRAADALDAGNLSMAQRLQEDAIEALRDAGREMAKSRAKGNDQEGQDGQSGQPQTGGTRSDTLGSDRDPAGRLYAPSGDTGLTIPSLSDPDRIRLLTEQLRERLSNPNIPPAEKRYLEDLLKRF